MSMKPGPSSAAFALITTVLTGVGSARAQTAAPSSASFEEDPPPPPAAPAPPPAPAPLPPPAAVPPAATAAPAAAAGAAAAGPAAPAPHPAAPAAAAARPAAPPPAIYEPPPPPPKAPDADSDRLTMSARVDVLSLIFDSRLGIELESQAWKFISVELTPVFVISELSPSLKSSTGQIVTQHSDGLGPMAGAALGVAFWFNGKPMRGTGVEALFTNYAYRYESRDELGKFDEVSHVDQRLYAVLNSRSVWGIFTMAGAFGLGVELNRERRCFPEGTLASATANCREDMQLLALERGAFGRVVSAADIHSSTYPIQLLFRLSVGVTF